MSWTRRFSAAIGFGGFILFAAGFVFSFLRPTAVESLAAGLVRMEVEREVRSTLDGPAAAALMRLAAGALSANAEEGARLRRLSEALRGPIARVSAEMRDPDCPCRSAARTGLGWTASMLGRADARLTRLIRSKYLDVAARLTREFRIFCAANALVMLFLGIAVVARPGANVHLLPPALILVGAAAITAYLYLFQQDWLHTIVFGDYVGLGYFAYLGAATVLLADVVLNRARVATRLLNLATSVLGGAVSVTPC